MAGESKLQRQCVKCAENYGLLVRKVHAEGHKGWPDLEIIFKNGETIRFEVKNPNGNGRLSSAQIREHNKIKNMGAIVHTVANFDEFFKILIKHLKSQD
ncbi:MAG: hypothetical protein COA71_14760 [SAR86 cluster bacterium]|uniref:VRR-NUC domain-containing protein n=1 Tax=SAR86 cluster bacterium TaxID=2030880 RepID=A0A2A5C503_9GAMM|nr:MAG: hypothetical protein COA71_14760 [SAR86 cluster bacterium]